MATTGKQLQLPLRNSLDMDTSPEIAQEQLWDHSAGSLDSRISMDALASPKGNLTTQPVRYTASNLRLEKQISNSSSQSSCLDTFDESMISLEKSDSFSNNNGVSTISKTDCSSLPSDRWEWDIEKYKKDMPPHIKVGYIDVLILYAEEDRPEVEKFQQHLINDIILDNYGPVKAWLYDCDELQALCEGKIGHLEEGVRRSTYVFMYLTANFVKDKWMELSSESCLMEAIYNPEKMWCVVPVYTQKRSCCTFKIPMGLNTLKGINYYNPDEFYRKGVKRLIGDMVKVRVNNELEHKKCQKQWIETEKRRVAKMREEQKRLQEFEEGQTRLTRDRLTRETNQLMSEGVIPEFHRHFPSESSLSTHEPSLSQSVSTGSLKSFPSQNPEYFEELESGYGKNQQNPSCYTEEQFAFIEQSAIQNSQTPLMNMYQPDFKQPSLNQSVLYSQQQHMVKRASSNSTLSGDGGARSTQIFKLKIAQEIMDIEIPMELHEKILPFPEDKKQIYVMKYLQEYNNYKTERNLSHLRNQVPVGISQQTHNRNDFRNSGNTQHQSNVPYVLNQNLQQTQGAALNPDRASADACQSLNIKADLSNDSFPPQSCSSAINNNLPNLQDLSNTSYQKSGPVTSGTTSQPLSCSTSAGSSCTMPGKLPYTSMLDEDCPSMPCEHGLSHNITQMPESEKDSFKEANNRITNDDECNCNNNDGNRQKKKDKPATIIKNIKINVYSTNTVQIGDSNIVQDIYRKDNDDDEEEEYVNDVRQSEYEKVGPMKYATKSIGTSWKGRISDLTNTHGEMPSSPETAVVDAAPSTHHPSKVANQKLIQSRSQDINEAIIDDVTDKKKNEQKLGLEDSGNMNSNHLTSGKTVYKSKELSPFRPQTELKAEKQFQHVKPITAVRPQIRDNNEIKKTFETEETALKPPYASEDRDDEQTVVKQRVTSSLSKGPGSDGFVHYQGSSDSSISDGSRQYKLPTIVPTISKEVSKLGKTSNEKLKGKACVIS